MIFLQSDEHDDTPSFCRYDQHILISSRLLLSANFVTYRNTLTSEELINYLRENNILTWGGNVRETEGYQGTPYSQWRILYMTISSYILYELMFYSQHYSSGNNIPVHRYYYITISRWRHQRNPKDDSSR